ncbi:ribosomal protection-like ABC-F family protein [Furfurilactobacillus curtus]|uniref:ABC transporter ATP-binding protein n=1 Tax=Furfurilactobacillus curtus TaxID=1746200 RepID=A0ABQ5JMS2_9LACO
MFILQATKLQISRQRKLLNIDQLVINPGDRIGLIGANGVGKTTLLEVLTGTLVPRAGHVDRRVTPTIVTQLHEISAQSGGEQVKQALIAAFREQPAFLALDEPSANLDQTNQQWLITHLARYSGTLLIISHDRHLLNAITTTTWSVADQQLTSFSGNYDAFQTTQMAQRQHQQATYQVQQRKQRRLAEAAQRREQKAAHVVKPNRHQHSKNELKNLKSVLRNNQGKLSKTASRLQKRAQLEPVQKPKHTPTVTLHVQQFASLGRHTPLTLEHFTLSAAKHQLSADLNLTVKTGEHVGIVGPNQIGKTTLLRSILTNNKRGITVNPAVKFGHFAQNMSRLNLTKSVWTNAVANSEQPRVTCQTVLAQFGFTTSQLNQRAGQLSGGQRVKLALVTVLLSDANVLLLDEPTNFLDLPTLTALENFLANYPGTILFVSHDYEFVEHVATRKYKLSAEGLTVQPVADQTVKSKPTANQTLLDEFRHELSIIEPDTSNHSIK